MRFRAASMPVLARLALGLVLCALGGVLGSFLLCNPMFGPLAVALGLMPPLLAADATAARVVAWGLAGLGLGVLLTAWSIGPATLDEIFPRSIGPALACGLLLGAVGFRVGPLIREDSSRKGL